VVVHTKGKSLYLCIGVFNMTAGDVPVWLYTNVNVGPGLISTFKQGYGFLDYGPEAVPIRTDLLIEKDLPAGYLGPVNPNPKKENTLPLSTYRLWASELEVKSSANTEADALRDCQASKYFANAYFQSKWGGLLLALPALLLLA
jgi:hypothetical protein